MLLMVKSLPKYPNCATNTQGPDKEWNFGRFRVKMYKCKKCGNQFREFFKENTLQFVLSAHNGGLGKGGGGRERRRDEPAVPVHPHNELNVP